MRRKQRQLQPDAAAGLLARFFAEEGFATPPARIDRNLRAVLADPMCWSALAILAGKPVGVVTVTTMHYVEWGKLAKSAIFMSCLSIAGRCERAGRGRDGLVSRARLFSRVRDRYA